MKIKIAIQSLINFLQILRDKRHQQKSKALAFTLSFSILPILVFLNLTISFFPGEYMEMIEAALNILPKQYYNPTIDFLNNLTVKPVSLVTYIMLIVLILYTIASNVRAIIEIANDCFKHSQDRTFNREFIISLVLFISILFAVISIFTLIFAGRALRTFLILNNASNIAIIISKVLQAKNLIMFCILLFVFYIAYYFAPNIKSSFKTTIIGTLISTIGLYIISHFFEIYLSKPSSYKMLYGARYSQYLLFLLGIYLVSQIIVLSIIVNSLIYDRISIKNYHLQSKR